MAKKTLVLTGDKKLNRKLKRLAGPDARKVIRQASRVAIKPVRSAAKSQAPHDSGALRRAIRIRAIKRSRSKVGTRITIGEKDFTGSTFYGGFQEWGWKTGKRGSQNRTHIEGKRFLKQAADSKRAMAIAIYRREIAKRITELAKT